MSKISKLFSLTALSLVLAAPLANAGPLDDAITARQACMKANGKAMGTFVPIVKGGPYDAAAVQAAIASVETACAGWATWWAPETAAGETVTTRAKPEIWTDAAGFAAAGTSYYNAVQALKATTDEAGFKAAFGAVGGSCQGCHEKFQAPKS